MQGRYALLGLLLVAMAASAQDTVHTGASSGGFSASGHFSAAPPTLTLRTPVVAGAPFSAEETFTIVQTLADGTHITHARSTRKLYRDSAGRTRTEQPMPGTARAAGQSAEGAPTIAEITDPVARVKYTLDTVGKVAHKQTMEAPKAQMPARRAPTTARAVPCPVLNDCAREGPKVAVERLGSQTVESLLVRGERRYHWHGLVQRMVGTEVIYLDTHVLIYIAAGEVNRLGVAARKAIDRDDVLASAAAVLELEFLHEIGRLRRPAAKAKPEIYEALEERGVNYAIRIPANESLERDIAELLPRPV